MVVFLAVPSCRACLGLCVLFLAKSKRVRQADMRVCHHIVNEGRAGGSSHGCSFFAVRFLSCFFFWFVFFNLATSKEGNED